MSRFESPEPNPYAPPDDAKTDPPQRKQRGDVARFEKTPWATKGLLTLLILLAGFCGFVVCAAVYEVASMGPDDYGMHRPMFQRSYIIAGATAALIGAASLIAWVRIRQHSRYGRLVAACALFAFFAVYVLNLV